MCRKACGFDSHRPHYFTRPASAFIQGLEETLNIEKQIQEDHSAKLIVDVEQEKMDVYKRRAATKISARSKIPGFRPGKAPYDLVVRTFGEGAV